MTEQQTHVVKVDQYQKVAAGVEVSYSSCYEGLPVHALAGLHALVAARMMEVVEVKGPILDLGGGSGALAQRLCDAKFSVTAVDLVEDNFRLHGRVPFIRANLNDDFSSVVPGTFAGISAVEIIEHLENPRHFLRECRKLLATGGHLVLTTPNVDNPVSKGIFLKSGKFQWFTDENYEKDGHISPITQCQLQRMIKEAGFTTVWLGTFGDPFRSGYGLCKRLIMRGISKLSKTPLSLNGEILVAVMRK